MGATNLARQILEDARAVDYKLLTPSQMVSCAADRRGEAATTSPWTVKRRGITYTIAAQVCTFDDPKDNVSRLPPADVCTPQAPAPSSATNLPVETQPDDFRRVALTITWDSGDGLAQLSSQTSLINNPSGGLGPRITKFERGRHGRARSSRAARRRRSRRRRAATSGAGTATARPTAPGTRPAARRSGRRTWQLGPAATRSTPTEAATCQRGTADTGLDHRLPRHRPGVRRPRRGRRLARADPAAQPQPPAHRAGLHRRREQAPRTRWSSAGTPNPERDIVGYEVTRPARTPARQRQRHARLLDGQPYSPRARTRAPARRDVLRGALDRAGPRRDRRPRRRRTPTRPRRSSGTRPMPPIL